MDCPRCGRAGPAGAFCGHCGADTTRPALDRFAALRPRAYVVAPAEPLLLPMVTSTLFPELPQRYRNPFRVGMAIALAGVVVLSAAALLAPLVSLVALGVPVLFMLYLWQSGVPQDIPGHAFALAGGLGAGLGVGWVWFTGRMVARTYGVPMAAGFQLENLVGVGLVVAVGGVVLMVLPAVAVRVLVALRRTPGEPRESLDGFTIGALGALSFTAAATMTRLGPQFVSGLLDNVLPLRRLTGAVLYGVAAPLTAAALGGLIGMLLWFRAGPVAARRRGRIRFVLLVFTMLVVLIHTAIWIIDEAPLARWPQLGLHVLMTVVAVLAARFCVQLALLHEEQSDPDGQPVQCANCECVVPELAFCPACGFASHALPRAVRQRRRESPPTRHETTNSADV